MNNREVITSMDNEQLTYFLNSLSSDPCKVCIYNGIKDKCMYEPCTTGISKWLEEEEATPVDE